MKKSEYRNEMDKIVASEGFRARAMNAMIEARENAPATKKPVIRFNYKYATIAACAVLVLAVGSIAFTGGLDRMNSSEMAAGGAEAPMAADTMAGAPLYPYEDGFDYSPSENAVGAAGEAFEDQKTHDNIMPETTAAAVTAPAVEETMWETTAATHEERLPSATITGGDSFNGVFADYIDDNLVYVGEKKFTFYICNKTEETLDLNYYYSIEKMNANGEWVPDERELVFIDLLTFLESGQAFKFTVDTSYLTEGRYRVIKPVGDMELIVPFNVVDKDDISETTTTMVLAGDEPVVVMTTSGRVTAPVMTAVEEAMLNAYKIDDKASYSSGEEISVGIVNLGGGNAVVETLPKILKYSNGTYAEAGGSMNISSPGMPIEPNSAISLQISTEGLSSGKYRAVFKMHNAFAVYDNGREDTLYIDFVIE